MPLIGNDFVDRTTLHNFICSECGTLIQKGEPSRASIKNGKVQKKLCMSEDCRLEFDARLWDAIATRNTSRRNKKREPR